MNFLHKLVVAGSAAAMVATATPTFARGMDASLSVKAHAESRIDAACLDVAVETRHEAKVDAYAEYRAAIAADLETRATALAAAKAIEDDEDSAAAVKVAWMAFFAATADARADLKTDIKAANQAFATAKADCIIDSDDEDEDENDDNGSGSLIKGWNGKDNGWHRGWFKNGKNHR